MPMHREMGTGVCLLPRLLLQPLGDPQCFSQIVTKQHQQSSWRIATARLLLLMLIKCNVFHVVRVRASFVGLLLLPGTNVCGPIMAIESQFRETCV